MQVNIVFKGFLFMFFLGLGSMLYTMGGQDSASPGSDAPHAAEAEHGEAEHSHNGTHLHVEPVSLSAGQKLQVTATTTILGDVVSNIAGDAAQVQVLMAIGQNPHAYEPVPRDMARLEGNHLVFVNGFNLEENLVEVLESVATGPIISASASIVPLGEEGHEEHDDHDAHDEGDHGTDDHHAEEDHPHEQDPHVWFSVANVISWVDVITDALSHADPANASRYMANAQAYLVQLEALDRETRQLLAQIPDERRILVTGHGIFGYFAQDYGFKVVGTIIPSTSTRAEASSRQIAQLIETVKKYKVPAIFVGGTESQALRNLALTIQQESGTSIKVMPTLTGSLTPEQPTYIEYFRYNLQQIVEGLSN